MAETHPKRTTANAEDKFWVKEQQIALFYEFIEELDRIPDSRSKTDFLRKRLYKCRDRVAPFAIITKYYMDRLLFEEAPKVKLLPLTLEDTERSGIYRLNLPQVDLLLGKGLDVARFRSPLEDFVYGLNSATIQRFLCDFVNCANLFKIPKDMLKEVIYDNVNLRLSQHKISDLARISENYVGANFEYLKNSIFLPKDYLAEKGKILPSAVEVRKYSANYVKTKRRIISTNSAKHFFDIVQSGIIKDVFKFRFPATIFTQSVNKGDLVYFIKHNSLIKSSLDGELGRHLRLACYSIRYIFLLGYYSRETQEFKLMVCNINRRIINRVITEQTLKIVMRPDSWLKAYDFFKQTLQKNVENFRSLPFKFSLARVKGEVFFDKHELFSYLLLNKFKNKGKNTLVMFSNMIGLSNEDLVIKKCVLTNFNITNKRAKIIEIATKEEHNIYYSRFSCETVEEIQDWVGNEVYLMEFEVSGNFVVMNPLKQMTFETYR